MNPLETAKRKATEKAIGGKPSESQVGQALGDAVVGVEHEQAEAVQHLIEATGLDAEHHHNPKERKERLLSLADAVAEGDVRGWWFEEIAPHYLDNPEQAEQYAGLSADEWHDQLREWYRLYHEHGHVQPALEDLETPGKIAEVADRETRNTFGIPLDEFVALVVTWDRGECVQQVLGGVFLRHAQLVEAGAQEVDRLQTELEALEEP